MNDQPHSANVTLPRDEDVGRLRAAILEKLAYTIGKRRVTANDHDWFVATALAVRDRVVDGWMASIEQAYRQEERRVYYLSLEFLVGRLLFDNMQGLGLTETVRAALSGLGVDLDRLAQLEPDAALGNGGLGRLAACYMESMASVGIPAHGYGIRYEHGLFRQVIVNGWQHEYPEEWLSAGNPWEFHRPEVVHEIGFGGTVHAVPVAGHMVRQVWHPAEKIEAVAYDTPVVGWRGRRVNTLRLWSARPADPLRLDTFNLGDHAGALVDQIRAESISKVLYPSDESLAGQELRLRQEYFFASASLQDLVRRHVGASGDIRTLPDKVAIQLNDTHPAIGVAEMMRILVDLHDIPWDEAWRMTQAIFCYTNHTLLPEALESWPVVLMERLLPRHMQIIYLINALHLDRVRAAAPGDEAVLSRVSLIEENHDRRVRMGHLAFVGSRRINGVSALHTDLLKETVFHDLNTLLPGRIVNKTNGITFRRWLQQANPRLTGLLVDTIGPDVLDRPEIALERLEPLAEDAGFRRDFAAARRANKQALATLIRERLELRVDPDAMFDVHIKRIHEYKRQLLNILETIALYYSIRAQPTRDWAPRVKIFAGKAAASYHRAKLIIKLAHDVARVVNTDPTVRDRLKVVFLPNYGVSLAESIIPAADLSEQISTAGMEASGTGNMKLALNGSLTIATLDGANVELREHVGEDNIFIFGLTTEEVEARRRQGISAEAAIAASPRLAEVLGAIESGLFSPDERDRYRDLVSTLRHHDHFMVCADFESYCQMQSYLHGLWREPEAWWRKSILNVARVGWFSSDRAIREYADDIWRVPVLPQ
ncbi:glycogen phosphorylase [Rhodovastum atsumiense]|uniref:Alpha-1,4 glucan phosphorylase n=1 Tax=Rhodovastum atsumiense TaxID=504468 RepID=A0A5M6IYH5_9PROT|nr:glycogen/starch/alpha-glucan phosphorylase [Rhodovastum atsumiense]KAA5612425.1 glycogen/starch/alpha-glucan phosphorylase [Rhodovastum atsumiense]CAH2600332.1 glycogen phosphorylase [Rhodovastum atsumiense]